MTKNNYTTKHEKNKHLTIKEKAQIEILLKQGMKRTQIAKEIGIARSTLYEELKRGTVEQMKTNLEVYRKYFADAGQYVYEKHRENSKKPYKLGKAINFIKHTEKEIIENKLSPDVICGYAKRIKSFENMVCRKICTIFYFILKNSMCFVILKYIIFCQIWVNALCLFHKLQAKVTFKTFCIRNK